MQSLQPRRRPRGEERMPANQPGQHPAYYLITIAEVVNKGRRSPGYIARGVPPGK
ncbi:MAG: hypothetical protein HY532_01865 [Chloroflexi bacterium]|nr:hypothetical protein [Chloroflexota bacterium]